MPNFSGLESKKQELVRKAIGGALFVGESGAAVIATLTAADSSLNALPTTGGGYFDAGLMTDDGIRFNRAVSQDDVTSFGQVTPTRTDITADNETVQVDLQETSKIVIGMYAGMALSALVPTVASGELKIVKPMLPSRRSYRVFALSVDGPSDAEIYIGKFFPRAYITNYADQAFSKGNETRWGFTMTAEKDTAVGASVVWFFGGPGWKLLLTQMGF